VAGARHHQCQVRAPPLMLLLLLLLLRLESSVAERRRRRCRRETEVPGRRRRRRRRDVDKADGVELASRARRPRVDGRRLRLLVTLKKRSVVRMMGARWRRLTEQTFLPTIDPTHHSAHRPLGTIRPQSLTNLQASILWLQYNDSILVVVAVVVVFVGCCCYVGTKTLKV